MATSIIPLAIAPPVTLADREFCSRFQPRYACEGRWSDPDDLIFYFTHHDGNGDHFTPAQLRAVTWWHAMPFDIVASLEAHLYPLERVNGVAYVARSSRGKLIRRSRLSGYFEERDPALFDALQRLRVEFPDAGVFGAATIEEAERLINAANDNEGVLLGEERLAIARYERFIARQAGARS